MGACTTESDANRPGYFQVSQWIHLKISTYLFSVLETGPEYLRGGARRGAALYLQKALTLHRIQLDSQKWSQRAEPTRAAAMLSL